MENEVFVQPQKQVGLQRSFTLEISEGCARIAYLSFSVLTRSWCCPMTHVGLLSAGTASTAMSVKHLLMLACPTLVGMHMYVHQSYG